MPLDGSEKVLVVPEQVVAKLGRWSGLKPYPRLAQGEMMDVLLEHAVFIPRTEDLERGPGGRALKQLVAYGVMSRHRSVFAFRRPSKGSESRLTGKCSVGIGGHISTVDAGSTAPRAGHATPITAMARELHEEVAVRGLSMHLVGLLNDDSNDVGRRHLGIVYRCEVGAAEPVANQAEVEPIGWLTVEQLREPGREWESWSRIAIDGLEAILGTAGVPAG